MKITDEESLKAFDEIYQNDGIGGLISDYWNGYNLWQTAITFANAHKSESIAKSFDDAWQSCGFEEPGRCDSHSVYMFKMGHEKGFEAGLKQGGENERSIR